jgi:UDP-glucose 4-epimerase
MMKVLVTGGAGYIGSHTCVELLASGYDVVIVDNLSNSSRNVIDRIERISKRNVTFAQADVTIEPDVQALFEQHDFVGVIHFAGYKAVGESVEQPVMYYQNNLVSTLLLSKYCALYGVNKFVFSSSATVYGDNQVPFHEELPLLPTTNPYGETKAMSERILTDVANVTPNLGVSILRYFNPVGAHESGEIGEAPNGIPNNLMPFVTQVARGKREKLMVFGNNYNTVDGTGVRDYIHVVDLAKGHVSALEKLTPGVHVYNLGTGEGTSVLELVHAFEEATGVAIPYEIVDRRPGDIAECYADVSKAERELGWRAEKGIYEMCKDAWGFERRLVRVK